MFLKMFQIKHLFTTIRPSNSRTNYTVSSICHGTYLRSSAIGSMKFCKDPPKIIFRSNFGYGCLHSCCWWLTSVYLKKLPMKFDFFLIALYIFFYSNQILKELIKVRIMVICFETSCSLLSSEVWRKTYFPIEIK